MSHKKGLTIEQIAHALKQKDGNVTEAASALEVTRQALHLRIQKNVALQQVLTDSRESLVDLAESALRVKIKHGDTACIIFTLKTQGKSRGYVERSEISGPDGKDLSMQTVTHVYLPDNGRNDS